MIVHSDKLRWLRRGATAIADQGLFATSGFLVNVLLARWLPREEYGAYALAFSIYLFLSSFHNALLLEPMSVYGPASYRNSLPEYLGRLFRLHFVVTVLLGLVTCIGITVVGFFYKTGVLLSALWGVGLGIPWMLLFWLWRRAAYLQLRPEVAARGAAANTFSVLTLMFVFHSLGWLTPFTAFVLQGIAGIIGTVVLIVSVRPQLRLSWMDAAMRAMLRQHWDYGRWVVVTAFVFWLAGDAYYVIVGSSMGMTDVAAFRAVQNFVRPISQFMVAITLLLVPWASARFADGANSAFQRAISRISMIFTVAAVTYLVGLLLLGRWLMEVLYGGKYTQFAYLLPFMALSILFTAAAEGPATAVRAMKVPSEIFWAYTAAAMLTIVPGLMLTRHWGLVGAALGLGISSLSFLVVITYRYRARIKDALEIEELVEISD
jgi:O-antigen/teichoic acid export membrane protein